MARTRSCELDIWTLELKYIVAVPLKAFSISAVELDSEVSESTSYVLFLTIKRFIVGNAAI